MGIDWGFAGQVGGVGFGMVFALLIILAVDLCLRERLQHQVSVRKSETGDENKGE